MKKNKKSTYGPENPQVQGICDIPQTQIQYITLYRILQEDFIKKAERGGTNERAT